MSHKLFRLLDIDNYNLATGIEKTSCKYLTNEQIKLKYYSRLTKLHPNRNNGSTCDEFMELIDAYKQYISGDDFLNCYMVIEVNDINLKDSYKCRCGSSYDIEYNSIGKIDCDCCSCFIYIDEPLKLIN